MRVVDAARVGNRSALRLPRLGRLPLRAVSDWIADAGADASGTDGEARTRGARAARLATWLVPSGGDLLLLGFLRLLLALPPYDTDLWWHLRTGEWILSVGRVPRFDPYSHTVAGESWVAHEWLAEIGLALAYRIAGLEAMAALQAVLLVGALAITYRHVRAVGATIVVYLPLMVVALILVLPAAHPRPYLVTLVFLAFLIHLLRVHRARRRLLVWAVPVLFVVWANAHAGFAIGLGALGLFVLGEAWERHAAPSEALSLFALAVLASLVTPYGARLLAYPFEYRAGSIHYALITEWASPDFHQPFSWLVMGFLAATVILLTARRAPGWRVDSLLVGAFGILALTSVRNIPLLAVVAAPILARQLVHGAVPGAPLLDALPKASEAGGPWRGVAAKLGRLAALDRRFTGIPLTAIALVATLAARGGGPSDTSAFDPATWPRSAGWQLPYAAAGVLGTVAAEGELFNDYAWGGYLIWRLWPAETVFIDGRADVYGEALLLDYAETVSLAPGWRERLDRHDIGRVLLPPDTPLVEALRLSDEWTVAYEDGTAVLLVRRPRQGRDSAEPGVHDAVESERALLLPQPAERDQVVVVGPERLDHPLRGAAPSIDVADRDRVALADRRAERGRQAVEPRRLQRERLALRSENVLYREDAARAELLGHAQEHLVGDLRVPGGAMLNARSGTQRYGDRAEVVATEPE